MTVTATITATDSPTFVRIDATIPGRERVESFELATESIASWTEALSKVMHIVVLDMRDCEEYNALFAELRCARMNLRDAQRAGSGECIIGQIQSDIEVCEQNIAALVAQKLQS